MIHNVVCHDCKGRISSNNSTRYASQESHNFEHQQPATDNPRHMAAEALVSAPDAHSALVPPVDLPNTQLISSRPASPVPTTRSHSLVVLPTTSDTPPSSELTQTSTPSETPPTKSVKEVADIANPVTELSHKRKRSITYNSEITKELDITFIHAFEHISSVNAVRFSPDGKLLAVGLTHELGKTLIYNLETKSMIWYVNNFIHVFLNEYLTESLSLFSALAEYSNRYDKKTRHIRCVCFSSDGKHVVVGASDGMIHVGFSLFSCRRFLRKSHRCGGLTAKEYEPHL